MIRYLGPMYKLTHNIESLVCLNYSTYISTRGHRYVMFIARTHKLVLSTLFSNRAVPTWKALPNIRFTVDSMSVFKHKLRNIDLKQFHKGH